MNRAEASRMNQKKAATARTKNISGKRFGKLVAVSRVAGTAGAKARWLCKCACGGEVALLVSSWGKTKSCGCTPVGRKPVHGPFLDVGFDEEIR
jgi:hypothetical protein